MAIAAVVLAVLGALIGGASAISALLTVGGEIPYQERLVIGWAALGLAVLTVPVALLSWRQPFLAAVLIFVMGLAGTVAINFFYINTFYVCAAPLWVAAAVAAAFAGGRKRNI